jgi:hypothetical protein
MSLTTNPSLLGQSNLSGSDTALFLKMFSGQVLTTYQTACQFLPLIQSATIGAGKSFQFPAIGRAEADYHIRGESIYDVTKNYLNNIELGERVIYLDRPLISAVFTDRWEEMVNHYETASPFADELGKALARKHDKQLARLLVLAARSAATLTATQSAATETTVDRTGHQIDDAAMATSASVFVGAAVDAMQVLVEKDVPMEELILACRPAQYFKMIEDGTLLNADYNSNGNGTKAEGKIHKAWGFRVVMTNHLPDSIVASFTGELNDYSGDFTDTVAVCFHPSAIGSVSRAGLAVEREYNVERQGDLVLAKIIQGHGILRPECAVELKVT